MDTEADNTNVPRNEDSDLQPDTGKEDRVSDSELSNMDRESTSKINHHYSILTILVYTRPDGGVETEPIIIPDDGQEDRSHREMDDSGSVTETIIIPDDGQEGRSHREMDDSGSVTVTTGNNTLGKSVRQLADTRQSYAPGDMLETGDHSLYQELLERVFQDPATEESDLEKVMMSGPSNKDQKLQEEPKQRQETRVFQDYLQKHELREEEVESFGE
jgi:hypothetical protein